MPAHPAKTFRWTFELRASPVALWPLVSNTDRFNRDCGYPPVKPDAPPPNRTGRVTNARRLRASLFGLSIVWEEHAFEWIQPERFGVARDYLSGPVARMVVNCELSPRGGGGTTLVYETQITPANLLGRLLLPLAVGRRVHHVVERVLRRYDDFALRGLTRSQVARPPRLAPGGAARLTAIQRALAETAGPVSELCAFVSGADDLAAARMRPYALADEWRTDRRQTLHLFLHATRAGLLDFRWELVCPHCRGATTAETSLHGLTAGGYCPTCQADFTANFDQSVELTFTPNASVRSVPRVDYCVGGPQVTPHIVAQQFIPPAQSRTLRLALRPGRYRVRSPDLAEQHAFHVADGAPAALPIDLAAKPLTEPGVAPDGEITIANSAAATHLAIVEHLAWSDQATTAAEVTSLQLFRDLFSNEVLRRGEKISVGSITIVFTDLKNSTQLYQEIGDAPAFGRVLTHFEILKAAVAREGGAVIKTMGDAIMAVFPRPVSALRAMDRARRWLARPETFAPPPGVSIPPSTLKPLALKAGLNCGPCLAINQNDRLDYFGTTVNTAARLCGLCSGADLILSSAVCADSEVAAHLAAARDLTCTRETARLKGFGDAAFEICRVR
jgi:class 3 adenylate cyclase